jgi:hypothetical protein
MKLLILVLVILSSLNANSQTTTSLGNYYYSTVIDTSKCSRVGHVASRTSSSTLVNCPPYLVESGDTTFQVYPACNTTTYSCMRCGKSYTLPDKESRIILSIDSTRKKYIDTFKDRGRIIMASSTIRLARANPLFYNPTSADTIRALYMQIAYLEKENTRYLNTLKLVQKYLREESVSFHKMLSETRAGLLKLTNKYSPPAKKK